MEESPDRLWDACKSVMQTALDIALTFAGLLLIAAPFALLWLVVLGGLP